jgi:hypothetical protein
MLWCIAGGVAGCGRDSTELVPIRLLHSPAVGGLNPQQLQALARECEKYPSNGWARGRYDAAYCEEAIAAWGDSPLQMVIVGPAKKP